MCNNDVDISDRGVHHGCTNRFALNLGLCANRSSLRLETLIRAAVFLASCLKLQVDESALLCNDWNASLGPFLERKYLF